MQGYGSCNNNRAVYSNELRPIVGTSLFMLAAEVVVGAIITVANNMRRCVHVYIDSYLILFQAHVRGSWDTVATSYACRVHKKLIMYPRVLPAGERGNVFSRCNTRTPACSIFINGYLYVAPLYYEKLT